ncbi:hypothetical protein FK535_09195 [Mycolicibacterium sp. 018/SC-01/001]|uniref:hypothetical protein n=1 Tax=Mycolicibacterium sp. 018/SC-01/001 TaxID=2592069 RepID=UPI00117C78A8|nr:hypothetical protein [Mycolicibacterium sp. 018/SC-01/001]TRW85561.1 hypothetical protein FK535_09195 [Mycolicibacterium sp. 018/SC-01/001]
MNPAVATVIGALVGGGFAVVVAIVNAAVGRDGRRADIADKVSQAWDPVFDQINTQVSDLKKECKDCRSELNAVKRALRLVIRAAIVHAPRDPAVDEAINAALDVLNSND